MFRAPNLHRSALSSIFRNAGIKNKWKWLDETHTRGEGNPTLSDECTALRLRTKKEDTKAGKTKQQAAPFEQHDLVLMSRKVKLYAA